MLIGNPLGEGSNASSTNSKLFLELRRSYRSGMLIEDPLSEGSNASSTENAQKGAACS